MSHAPFAPSSAKRWLNCPGSFALALQRPPVPDNEYSLEGTRLHGAASAYLTIPDQPVMSGEDYAAVKPYLDYAAKRIAQADAHAVEESIRYNDLFFGTPDLMLFFLKQSLLEVVDLKTGAGIMVDPEENDQGLAYAFLAVDKLLRTAPRKCPDTIRITIVQPPDEDRPVKSWDAPIATVLDWGQKAQAKMAEALAGGAEIHPGEWCRFCPAKPHCPVLRGEVVEALGATPPMQTMSPAVMSEWLDRADRLEEWINDLRTVAHDYAGYALARGEDGIPGWKLKPKRAMRQWADEAKVLEIARRRKIKIYQDKMLSPTMAEKAHPNLPQELRDQIVAVSSGVNLVRLKDGEAPAHMVKRPEEATKVERLKANIALMQHRR